MSKIGKLPIKIPAGTIIEIKADKVEVKGPKGSLNLKIRPEIDVQKDGDIVQVSQKIQSRISRSLWGLTRTLIDNMIIGVTQGYEKILEMHGVGYRAFLEGEDLKITAGFSHPVIVKSIAGIKFEVEGNNIIKISGIDKQLVGQTAAQIRGIRLPDAYKGKGIRYQGEIIKLKPGKSAKTGAAGA